MATNDIPTVCLKKAMAKMKGVQRNLHEAAEGLRRGHQAAVGVDQLLEDWIVFKERVIREYERLGGPM